MKWQRQYLTNKQVYLRMLNVPPRLKKNKKLSDQLRQVISDCGVTRYRIAKETGVSEAVLSRLMNGKGWLSVDSFDRLGRYLDLTIEVTTRRKGR